MAGEVWFGPDNLMALHDDERVRVLRKFGVMYQSGALFGSMTVLENVRLPLDEFTELPAVAKEIVALTKLKLVALEAAANKMPADLSGGMQACGHCARDGARSGNSLSRRTFGGARVPITSAGLDALIKDLARSLHITFVVVTHELSSIFAIANRVIMLDGNTKGIIAEGRPADLRDHSPNPWVRQFFNREAEPATAPATAN